MRITTQKGYSEWILLNWSMTWNNATSLSYIRANVGERSIIVCWFNQRIASETLKCENHLSWSEFVSRLSAFIKPYHSHPFDRLNCSLHLTDTVNTIDYPNNSSFICLNIARCRMRRSFWFNPKFICRRSSVGCWISVKLFFRQVFGHLISTF